MTSLRLVFMGTPDFAVPALHALHKAGHTIAAVYCQPPKPAGRGQAIHKTPVHLAAEALGLTVCTPKSLRKEEAQTELRAFAPEVIVVAAYGLILPQAVLDIPRLGCINIHGSLLPRWRGAAPLHRALLAGDQETGITIMQMDVGLDTGAMLMKEALPITHETTAQSLHDAMATLGARMIVPALEELTKGTLKATPQPEEGITYAAKLTREDGLLDWSKDATTLERQVRALYPWPGCSLTLDGEVIKVHKASVVAKSGEAGTLLDEAFTIACGKDSLRLDVVQRAGKKPMEGAAVLRGLRLAVGSKLS
ncbi:MAG: methionyl-tRNA formyltransferase [Alphaproteobacteria bacterium]|jgi:methionyl-tRNA formyltransferase|nr:methionyl-tRNA formyltransferase [Alphaproteobacteria bacterium]